MATLLYRLGATAFRRWPLFLAGWLVAVIAAGAVAATLSKPMSDAFSIPGIPSETAATLQSELFPEAPDAFAQATVNVVVVAPEGTTLDDPANRAAVDSLVADLAHGPQVPADLTLLNPVDAARATRTALLDAARAQGVPAAQAAENAQTLLPLSEDGRAGIIRFDFDVDSPVAVEPASQEAVVAALEKARDTGLTAEANGTGMQAPGEPGAASEALGIAVALIVLILTFGSLVAAGLPILTAVLGIALGISGVLAMTAVTDIGSSTPILATMLGLAVGIDYALFILARYQAELRRHPAEVAMGRAVGTAGSAVVFAGLTVVIALGALTLVGIPFLTSMGLAAAGTVLVAVLIALTLLPAILGGLKGKAFAVRVLRPRHPASEEGARGMRWARLIARRPLAVVMVVVIGLGALALPTTGLRLAFPTDSTAPTDTTQRKASDLVSAYFGPGREAPLLVVADGRDVTPADRPAAFGAAAAWAGDQPAVKNAQVVASNADGSGAQILVTPTYGPDDVRTETLLDELRSSQSATEARTGLTLGVTGLTAINTDVSQRLSGALPTYLAVVVGLAFLLLTLVFRSILVPVTATLGFLLSVMATFGATVAVFQEGAFGLMEPQPIVSFMPVFLVGMVFGLAMDYQVFLVTRMREAHVHGAGPVESVIEGFHLSSRVVTAAALIMISVFAAFMLQEEPIVRSMGFALATAIFLDAFVVRMTLIPALMYLLGERAWWLPRWLDRWMPRVDVEGAQLATSLEAPTAGEPVGATR